MKTLPIAAAAIVAAGLSGCVNFSGWPTVHGSGNVLTETRTVSGFDRVSVAGSGELILTQGEEESLTIEADDNLLPLIRSDVEGGRLFIGPHQVNLRPTRTIQYRLNVKKLDELDLSGSLAVRADAIKTERLRLRISGSGKVDLGNLEAQELSIEVSGSGDTTMRGQVQTQRIHISGSGDHRAPDLKSARAEVHISGSGHALIWVTDELEAHISGSGSVRYRGRPSVESHVSGSGKIRPAGE